MRDKDAAMRICSRFCSYYKPGKNEELACLGYLIGEKLIKEGCIQESADAGRPLPKPLQETLMKLLCPSCDFYLEDCDFILSAGQAPSCGGFRFLCAALSANLIAIDDIAKML